MDIIYKFYFADWNINCLINLQVLLNIETNKFILFIRNDKLKKN